MSADKLISSGGPWEGKVGYSRAVVAGNYVHVSGSTATVEGVVQHPGDSYNQTLTAFSVIEMALAQVGLGLKDIVRNRIYVSSAEHGEGVMKAHGELFSDIRPALTVLSGLGFVDPAMLVEIESDAYSRSLGGEQTLA